jgi:hypothetical protein
MGRRCRHLNHANLGSVFAIDARFLGLTNGAAVGTWADRGGSGRQVTGTGTARPTLDGNYVVFDGSNDEMIGSDSGLPTGDLFVSMVSHRVDTVAFNTFVAAMRYGQASAGSLFGLYYATNADFGTNSVGITQSGNAAGISASTGFPLILQVTRSSTTYTLTRNLASTTSKVMQTNTALAGSTGAVMGKSIGGAFAAVKVGGISIFSGLPSEMIKKRVAHSQGYSFKIATS